MATGDQVAGLIPLEHPEILDQREPPELPEVAETLEIPEMPDLPEMPHLLIGRED